MRKCSVCYSLAGLTLLCGIASGLAMAADPVAKTSPGVTRPSDMRVLSFVRPGRVTAVLVKEGDEVKKGQVIAKQDDTEEQAELKVSIEKANDNTEIEVNHNVYDLDKQTLEKTEHANGGASKQEIAEARQKVFVDDARIKYSEKQKHIAGLDQEHTQAAIDKLTLVAPGEGGPWVVLESFLKEGEAADAQNMKVVRIIQRDPLWVETQIPYTIARHLHVGDAATVQFSEKTFSDQKERSDGKVTYIAAMGSSASETILVRVELPNPKNLPPGENVKVSFPGAVAAKP